MAVTTSAAVRLLRRLLRQISVTEEKVGVIRALCRSVPRSMNDERIGMPSEDEPRTYLVLALLTVAGPALVSM